MQFVATTFGGLEPVLAREISALGGLAVTVDKRAVAFAGDMRLLYAANLALRTALRVLRPIARFDARSTRELYDSVKHIAWDQLMDVSDTLAVDSAVHSPHFRHSKYAALVVKDAIADRFREQVSARPSVDLRDPTLRIHLHIRGDRCTLSLDSSGESLHHRGYRLERTEAPLSEVVAAAIVQLSGWDGDSVLVDPMCGSGTIAIEAALVALGRAPGLMRERFALMRWRDFDRGLWESVRAELAAKEHARPPGRVVGVDSSEEAVAIARNNAARAGVADTVDLRLGSFEQFSPPEAPGVLVMDPPYGRRLSVDNVDELARSIGNRLKAAYGGYRAWLVAPSKGFYGRIGLKSFARHELDNGGITVELRGYEIRPRQAGAAG